MKEVKAIIQPHMLHNVVCALHELAHFPGITIVDVQGQGRGAGKEHAYQPTVDEIFKTNRKLLEIVCADDAADQIAETIRKTAHTGHKGDGLIVISDISEVIRIRSDERNQAAV